MNFWWHANLQLATKDFVFLKEHTLKKTCFIIFFVKDNFSMFLQEQAFKEEGLWDVWTEEDEPKKAPKWEKPKTPQNTDWDQTLTQKSSKKPIF